MMGKSPMMKRVAASRIALACGPGRTIMVKTTRLIGKIRLALSTSSEDTATFLANRVFARRGLWAQRRRGIFSSIKTSCVSQKDGNIVLVAME